MQDPLWYIIAYDNLNKFCKDFGPKKKLLWDWIKIAFRIFRLRICRLRSPAGVNFNMARHCRAMAPVSELLNCEIVQKNEEL